MFREGIGEGFGKDEMTKRQSLELFDRIGLPTLPHVFLNKYNFREQVAHFVNENQLDRIQIRTDGKGRSTPSLRNVEPTEEVLDQIEQFFDEGYSVILSSPGNNFRNTHSVNIQIKTKEAVIDDKGIGFASIVLFEAVGPGFTARELNRNNKFHEYLEMDMDLLAITKRKILPENYADDRQEALENANMDELERYESLLLENEEYAPLNSKEIEFLKGAAFKLDDWGKTNNVSNFTASMSFIELDDKIQPAFWDLILK